jgi:DNA polymerase I-like protein with 3'-5' exonuclease and polymerase domains
MSYAAKEYTFLSAIKEGKDLHSMSASLIFDDKWVKAALPDCEQLKSGAKCSCPEHEKLRKFSKAISFGLAYGLTHIGLADRLDISRDESKLLMDKFFTTFPSLRTFFESSAEFGMKNRYIAGLAPTCRIRFSHPPSNEGELQAIGRESKNYPIQECNASMLKIALIKLRQYILQNNYPAQLCLPVHDEILSACREDKATEWAAIQDKAMREAADMFLEPGLLGTDTTILKRWTK